MADNVTLNSGTGGDSVAADDIAGIKHQRIKIQHGADGSATDVSSASPLPVNDASGSLTVDAPVGTPVFVRLSDGSSAIATLPVSLASLPALAAGTNAIGKLAANSGVVIGDVNVTSLPAVNRPSTSTLSNVSGSATSVTLLSSTAGRLGCVIVNDSTASCYVKFGTTASTTSYSRLLLPNDSWVLEQPVYTGRIDAIWSAANGAARITELTA